MPINQAFSTIFSIQFPSAIQESGFCWPLSLMDNVFLFYDKWFGLLHHVCNEHEWTGGMCEHKEITEHELPSFNEKDNDYKTLQKLVLDPTFLDSLKCDD